MATDKITAHPTPWLEIILICRKCSKKLDGEGFGPAGKASLAQDLKRVLRTTPHRRTTRVIETKCLGICPRNAVTVLPATSPAAMLTIPAGTDTASLLPRLLLPPKP